MTTFRRAPAVAEVETDERDGAAVYLGLMPQGPLVVLEGSALAIWRAVTTEPGPAGPGTLVAQVAALAGVAEETVREDVTVFVARLVEEGFLVVADDADGRGSA